MEGGHHQYVEGHVGGGLRHGPDAGRAADICNLVGVGGYGGGAAGQDQLREPGGGHHTALNVHMGVDEAGDGVAARSVDLLVCRVGEVDGAYVRYDAAGDGYVPLDDGLCKNIHNLDVFYHQIEGFFPNN